MAPFFVVVVFLCYLCVLHLLVVLVRLSVPVQVIDWKDSSPKWPILRTVIHSLSPLSVTLCLYQWRN